jgi:hypothetical protein
MAELTRLLGSIADRPPPRAVTDAAGLDPVDPEAHTWVFVLNCPPYASVYLGSEGMMGGEAADRAAGFWRALGLAPPAEADHLACLLGLLAALSEPAGPSLRAATAEAVTRFRRSLIDEHLRPWLAVFLPAVSDLGVPALAQWAELLRHTLDWHAGRAGGGTAGAGERLPLALRAGPPPARAGDLDELLDSVLAPARCGFVITRAALRAGAESAGAGPRVGERRFTLRSMLEQQPGPTLRWLAGEAARWAARHRRQDAQVSDWWAGRAEHSARLLCALASDPALRLAPAGAGP